VKHLHTYALFSLSFLMSGVLLSGCSGFSGAAMPDASGNPSENNIGTIQGNVFGGHAPLVGAHVYLLQPGVSGTGVAGYGSQATSLLTGTYSGSYATTQNTGGDPSAPSTWYFETTDSNGAFNISNDYKCVANQPVYLYAYGGSPTFPGNSNTFNISQVVVSNQQGTGNDETATYTLTTTTTENFYIGELITFDGFGGIFAGGEGTTGNVLATNLTTNTFAVTESDANDAVPTGTYMTTSGTAVASPTFNPGVVNLAMLGNCPGGTLNFSTGSTALQYVYINEVSTVAAVYAMAGFTNPTTYHNDAIHFGIPTGDALALQGLTNAALNANQLYNIQGGDQSTVYAGEGHIARAVTPALNGTVPQAEMDTLGNILAACVDSQNTYNPVTKAGTASPACNTLFNAATSNGATSGTAPLDTATAAINMAHNPGAAAIVALNSLPTGNVPFTPNLGSTAPKDFTVALTYNNIATPDGIAIDASGNAYVVTNSTSSYVTMLSPQGAVLKTSAAAGSGFNFVAVDPAGNVWTTAGASNDVYKFTSTLGAVTGSPYTLTGVNTPTSLAIDSSNNVYVANGGNSGDTVLKLTSAGLVSSTITNNCLTRVTQITLDAASYIWGVENSSNNICRVSNPGGTSSFSTGGQPNSPTNVAIDSSGNGWASAGSQTNLYEISPTGTGTAYGVINNNAVGGLSSPTWVAVDGNNDVWVANTGNSFALSEFTHAGTAITGTSGYQSGNLNAPSSVALDGSGDVWVPNFGTSGTNKNTVTEIIGAATPVVTPLSAQKLGVAP
jgi:sugar lactone lactonase YvrE